MLNHVKSVVYGFSLFPRRFSFVFVGKLAFRALFFGHLFFGARNSENCLNQFLGKCEVRAVGSIRNPFLVFKLQASFTKIRSLIIKTMIHFGFLIFVFCL